MIKFFKQFGLSFVCLFFVFLAFIFLVSFQVAGLTPYPHLVTEFESNCVSYGYFLGLFVCAFVSFLINWIVEIFYFIKSKRDNRNQSSTIEGDNK